MAIYRRLGMVLAFAGLLASLVWVLTAQGAQAEAACPLQPHRIAGAPDLRGDLSVSLRAVAAAGPADVWAAGSRGQDVLIEHWTGVAWQLVPVANPHPGLAAYVGDLAVINPHDIWLAGSSSGGGGQTP